MKVFVTGVAGQLGYDVIKELTKRGHDGLGSDIVPLPVLADMPYVQMDITDAESVEKIITEQNPDAVIHCAAWTAVDAAEEDENKEKVYEINVSGTQNIANACKKIDCKMLYISTDYVFDGKGITPWAADCKDYGPLCEYGRSKLEGEFAVSSALEKYFIVRTAWVFGYNGNNFVKTMLNVGKRFDSLKVVNDQIGTPTYTRDLACLLIDMIETDKYGYYHATNEGGYVSWYEFACEIFKKAVAIGHEEYAREGFCVHAVTTEEYGTSKARRPCNSRLSKDKLIESGFALLPIWQDALERYLKGITF